MFISKLGKTIESYDKYGHHRLNGVKAVYILIILLAVNLIFSIPNAYFYFFYIPIMSMTAETAGETIKEKYMLFFFCMGTSIVTVFLFSIFASFWYFAIFGFIYALSLYLVAIEHKQHNLVVAPIALSLGCYSLLYRNANASFYEIMNNSITTILVMTIILGALLFFPLSYYYRLWMRAFLLTVQQIIDYLSRLLEGQSIEFDPISGHTMHMVRFANMLPYKFPTYSVLKMNVLVNELHLMTCFPGKYASISDREQMKALITYLIDFKQAVEQERPCELKSTSFPLLDRIVNCWNDLCSNL